MIYTEKHIEKILEENKEVNEIIDSLPLVIEDVLKNDDEKKSILKEKIKMIQDNIEGRNLSLFTFCHNDPETCTMVYPVFLSMDGRKTLIPVFTSLDAMTRAYEEYGLGERASENSNLIMNFKEILGFISDEDDVDGICINPTNTSGLDLNVLKGHAGSK